MTNREWEIARLIADDLSNQEIADELIVSVKTVESHIRHIFAKLDIASRAGVPRWVHREPAPVANRPSANHAHDDLKPDPLTARTDAQLEHLLRRFWTWSDHPSSREIAARAGGVFSHATISKLLNDRPGKPPLKLKYVLGIIRGCGGDALEEQLWATAWRRIHLSADHL
ncbi:helix-turn-helix transcriptional regulator [Spirillospora sp. NPDC048819]|uniref:response regulator transcription factor n=1 Tax=Spirillospora sp. NPDC048819 TaxID=3155268 RepID=UPI0033D6C53D